ncbi:MAG: crotonase/enoyl-CoA hydratase family protein [Acidimicrobiales bacterium]|nr:crotonase/enoyl-CoA hydratase family protein [Acidimicrobiales bacterium]
MTLTVDVADHIATITLNRPDRLNAFNVQMMRDFITALDRTDADDDVRAVIVTGAGRAFCAGADLERGGETFDHGADSERVRRDGGGMLTLRIFDSAKPIIAAINGPAAGIGITMTLPMDIRLASDDSKIGFVFAKRGIVTEAASSWFLPRLVGMPTALEWCYSGRVMPAAEAAAAGLVRTIPHDELMSAARELASEFAENAPVSVALTRQLLWRGLTLSHPMEAHRADSRAISELGRSDDAREGVESFLEKRQPVWRGRPSTDLPDVFPDYEAPPFM